MEEYEEKSKEDMYYQEYMLITKLVERASMGMINSQIEPEAILGSCQCIKEIYRHLKPLAKKQEKEDLKNEFDKCEREINKFLNYIRKRVETDRTFNVQKFLFISKDYAALKSRIEALFDKVMDLRQECNMGIPTYYRRNRDDYLKKHMGV